MSDKREHQINKIIYNAAITVERISRYTTAGSFCKGKRVLDIACGNGLGSAYIADTGADSTLGVDLSEEAIKYAQTAFFGEAISFIAASATDVKTWNPDNRKFDVIICFDISEYASEMETLLITLREALAPNGTMLIGYPNASIAKETTTASPVFDRSYSLKEFQKITTEVLGKADQWLVGTPIVGMTVLDAHSIMLSGADSRLKYAYRSNKINDAIILPTQHLEANDAAYYLGIWNGNSDPLLIGSPLSCDQYLWPWNIIDDLKDCLDENSLLRKKNLELKDLIKITEDRINTLRRTSSFELDKVTEKYLQCLDHNRTLDSYSNSRAHRLARLYTRTAIGKNPFAKIFRFSKAAIASASRALGRKIGF